MAVVRESFDVGKTVSMAARQRGVNLNQRFH
ncbi:hypothetical protein IHE31_02725 (plasmid) [Mycetohabitans rhizoxinica]